MTEMRQLFIKDIACTYVYTFIGTLLALKQTLLCVEGVQYRVIFVLIFTLTKHIEDLEVTRQSV